MTESVNGLRFDIYERVHLPEDASAIEELEEIELIPHIQAIPSGGQVLLKGHLLLTGSYRSADERSEAPSRMEHWIPVEISLPPSRVEKLENLSVEIDNFDVDLLSSRSLNVTGVLGLRGVQMTATQASAPIWQEDGFTVVHQAQNSFPASPELDEGAEPAAIDGLAQAQPEQEQAEGEAAYRHTESQEEPEYEVRLNNEASEAASQEPVRDQTVQVSYQPAEPEEEQPAQQAIPEFNLLNADYADTSWGDVTIDRLDASRELPPAQEPSPQPPDKTEVKVGFAPRQASEPPASSPAFGVGLLSQLGERGGRREAELQAAEEALTEAEAEQEAQGALSRETSGDEIEWARLFLSQETEGQSFRKVKLCIVQREDTLEAIAIRYNVQPRELQLYNRMSEPHVSEGQIIYIP
ncbi:LysM peptidoglycan-binding domain-containing protein [Cohnella lubricantis]|uniref:LysM peptidoglycan-binding domain-containing protein n=1 Tax=Cohnella lubricantis TaxID=2163172 RepID=A0A841T7W6_9BACL|nr:LysM peptidoglycan-binding domain-containing protein [Cohnella lubricantis]MBB6677603.1 LysM peptidoglycan-binding domain-containing protein [Cohnella lubricantis]MBP2116510.1 stage VI sporulation protein D [Cohnella lubricantis]